MRCEECDRAFDDELAFNQHMRDRHGAALLTKHDIKEMKKAKRAEEAQSEHSAKKRSRLVKRLAVVGVFIGIALVAGHFITSSGDAQFTSATGLSVDGSFESAPDPALGSEDAVVTILAFEDFECPFCNRFNAATKPLIEQNYIETGKVRFVYKDFPLSFAHPNAQKAAEAAQCAFEQNRFWEYHDLLFANAFSGDMFTQLSGSRAVEVFKGYASDIGIDRSSFDECLDSGAKRSVVLADLAEGQRLGVRGTPSFLVNGQLIVGVQPFATFAQLIESELAKA